MSSKDYPALIVDEEAEKDAKLFCDAKRDDQALVIAFQSGLKVGKAIAGDPEKR